MFDLIGNKVIVVFSVKRNFNSLTCLPWLKVFWRLLMQGGNMVGLIFLHGKHLFTYSKSD